MNLLKIKKERVWALTIVGIISYFKNQTKPSKILILLSVGNVDQCP